MALMWLERWVREGVREGFQEEETSVSAEQGQGLRQRMLNRYCQCRLLLVFTPQAYTVTTVLSYELLTKGS